MEKKKILGEVESLPSLCQRDRIGRATARGLLGLRLTWRDGKSSPPEGSKDTAAEDELWVII